MGERNDLVLSVLAICAIAALLGSPVACTMHRDATVAEVIKAGADPIDARCALTNDHAAPMCMVRAAVKK